MTTGEGATAREIRIRPVRETSQNDVEALLTWLTREPIVQEKLAGGEVRVQQRPTADGHGTPMGLGMEIVLIVVQGVAAAVIVELMDQAKSAVREWRANRRSVGEQDPPDFDVTSDRDER
ncbi:hypothetical protein [Streptomyces sp. NPDC000410]|uniref:hypothetical protein n=1 Tax=Streptomyces sp. NPDC000410 TaxID=3154254 RepID=UPI00332BFDCE